MQGTEENSVVIVGAGVVGVMTALSFAKRGHKVTVIDSASEVAEKCSYANAGILGICHATPWAGPEALPLMFKALIGRAPGIRLTNLCDPALWTWGISFLRNCTPAAHRKNSAELRRLSMYSRNLLAQTEQEMDLPKDTQHNGGLYLFQDSEQFDNFSEEFEGDENFEILTPDGVVQKDPFFADIAQSLAGAIFSRIDSVGDCRLFTQRTSEYLRNKRNVQFRLNETVTGFQKDADAITKVITDHGAVVPQRLILAAGNATPELCKHLGFYPKIYPVKGYAGTWTITDSQYAPRFPFIDETELVAVANYGAKLRVTTLAEFDGLDKSLPKKRTDILDGYVRKYLLKAVDLDSAQYWCGHRPATPSSIPYLGRIKNYKNAYINAGHGQLGWTLAQGCAEILAEM